MTLRRVAAASGIGGAAAVASWLALAVAGGNVGLQRSVAVAPTTLFERPEVLALMAVVAFMVAWLGTRSFVRGCSTTWALQVATIVLLADVFGAGVLAPALVGELEVGHATVVFAVISGLGVQPAAALAGARLGVRSSC